MKRRKPSLPQLCTPLIVLISEVAHVDDGLDLPNHFAFPGADARVKFNTLDTNTMTYRKAEVISIILLDIGVNDPQLKPT